MLDRVRGKKIGIYLRKDSTNEDLNNGGYGRLQWLRYELEENEGSIETFIDDTNTPLKLVRLLEEIFIGNIEIVVIWSIEDIYEYMFKHLALQCKERKVEIISFCESYSEPFETNTPAGKMQFQIMALIGEFERGTIAQNVKMGMCAKARAGEWCGGRVLGYDLVQMEKQPGAKSLQEEKEPFLVTLSDDVSEEIPYEFIKSILENFSKVLTESETREQQKKLLHMIISEITINEAR